MHVEFDKTFPAKKPKEEKEVEQELKDAAHVHVDEACCKE